MINRVQVVKNPIYFNQFQDIELRIGDADATGAGAEPLTNGKAVGHAEFSNEGEHDFIVDPPSDGRLLTLQNMGNASFSLDEIDVYVNY